MILTGRKGEETGVRGKEKASDESSVKETVKGEGASPTRAPGSRKRRKIGASRTTGNKLLQKGDLSIEDAGGGEKIGTKAGKYLRKVSDLPR